MGISAVISIILGHAPTVIDLVGRLLGDRKPADRRTAAAKELFEVVGEAVKQDWSFDDVSDLSSQKLFKAIEDEEKFIEKLANLNDAIYQFSKYVNSQEVDED